MYAEPTWKRLGYTEPPAHNSGKGIGIIIIDDISPHPALRHLDKRLKHVVVSDDYSVTCMDIANESFDASRLDHGIHGLMTMLTLAHQPFISGGLTHIGIASEGNFVVLSHGAFRDGEGERLKQGIDWILENLPEFNIRMILNLGWHALDNTVLLERTKYNSTVQALAAAVNKGLLVVCANGNCDISTILPPIEFLAVGGFNDRGVSLRTHHVPYPGELFGFNGDGYFRPDIRAPRTRIAVPYCEGEPSAGMVSYYTGTSAASTMVAGVCMYLLSTFPSLSIHTLRNALVAFGDRLTGDINSAPCINVKATIEAITRGYISDQVLENEIVDKSGIVERAISLSRAIRKKLFTRDELWEYSNDPVPLIRKIAVYSLGAPADHSEREKYWHRVHTETEDGIRAWYLYGLLQNAEKEEMKRWIPLADSPHWTIRWCVVEFLRKFPDLPQLEKTHVPEQVSLMAQSVLEWLNEN